ncbi:aldo/keto reductase [Kribbella deserti]|uniref:Aldo/keto reductase n=1 Tax=Kribbella deserti TaxID=1926257 RepID=A0ABV6QQL6_9ACTN
MAPRGRPPAGTTRPFPEVYDHPGTTARLKVLGEVAKELGMTPGQVVLAWLLPSIKAIIGASSRAQLDEALTAGKLELTDDQRTRLDAAH